MIEFQKKILKKSQKTKSAKAWIIKERTSRRSSLKNLQKNFSMNYYKNERSKCWSSLKKALGWISKGIPEGCFKFGNSKKKLPGKTQKDLFLEESQDFLPRMLQEFFQEFPRLCFKIVLEVSSKISPEIVCKTNSENLFGILSEVYLRIPSKVSF